MAPRTRAANCEAATEEPLPLPALLRAPAKPPLGLPRLTGPDERTAPDPDAEPLPELLDSPALELPETAPDGLAEEAVDEPDADVEAPLPAAAPPPLDGDELGGAGGGLLPGMPAVGAVQAHAKPTPTTADAKTNKPATATKRTHLNTKSPPARTQTSARRRQHSG